MDERTLFFFQDHPRAIPLYEELERQVLAAVEGAQVQVKKTQISFCNRHMFACASFARVRRAAALPELWLTVTFGLDHQVESPRIDVATQPYPGRWTHHLVISSPEEIDEQLMDWLRLAAAFSDRKR